ncbi:GNAT family N-acetyltransferase [Parabacteroides sp. FAFU027]|uniref:GNAT family N-acetyltransferase n=1 Tax=Parabacteroides sp. FAFU027 TaxID=2922715 RepID=UPI001FAE92CB|nr:GNAT family N-acetyltransferase [Parabacteroides sp. FAFU027]
MVIRNAIPNDYESLKALWLVAFSDEESYIESFLRNKWMGDNCLVVEEEGRLVSMLFLLHAEIITDGKHSPAWYIYACATATDFRGMGFMKMLLDEAYREAVSQSVFALLLVPASDDLFRYYEKASFHRLYKKPLSTNENLNYNNYTQISGPQIDRILVRRDTILNRELDVCWDLEHLIFATGGAVSSYLTKDGYLIEEVYNNERRIIEQLPEMLEAISDEDYAMIRFCESYDLSKLGHLPYFNLALD